MSYRAFYRDRQAPLELRYGGLLRDYQRQARTTDKEELLARLYSAEEPNPAPFYSYLMSAYSLVAVYKANHGTVNFDIRNDPVNAWAALSYATDRGVVFG